MARIFLSYSSDQRALAERIAISLRGDDHTVFFDREALPASASFHGHIRRDIRRSNLMVFLITPRAVRSGSYALTELRIAQREWASPRFRVVPVMVLPTAFEDIPGFLREVTILEPEGNPVGELTHAVDWVLRRNRRRMLLRAAMVTGGLAILGGVSMAAYRAGIDAGWIDATEHVDGTDDPPPPSEGPQSPPPKSSAAARGAPRVSVADTPLSELELSGGVTMRLRQLPGGVFTMGAPEYAWTSILAEPQHEVRVDTFWIAETEVTQAQWSALMGTTPSNCELECGPRYPVNHVTHHDAVSFTNRLSQSQGLPACYRRSGPDWAIRDPGCTGYRLPTEAEWEYAARASVHKRYGYGDDPSQMCEHGNGRDLARLRSRGTGKNNLPCDDGYANLAPVASFAANAWGLFDMHGNVWEWTEDASPESYEQHVIRGGSYLDGSQALRVANRNDHPSGKGRGSVGSAWYAASERLTEPRRRVCRSRIDEPRLSTSARRASPSPETPSTPSRCRWPPAASR